MGARERIQNAFIRTCRDSGFKLETMVAARLAADTIGISPLEVWTAIGSLDAMDRIASGDHPVCAPRHSKDT